jgi:hypothetical protein
MTAATYKPTQTEKEAFNRLLTRYAAELDDEGEEFTEHHLRALAQHHWPGKNVVLNCEELGVGWIESEPDLSPPAPQRPATPAAAAQFTSPEPEPEPVQLDAHGRPIHPAVAKKREQFVKTYGGNPEGVKVVTAQDHSLVAVVNGEARDASGTSQLMPTALPQREMTARERTATHRQAQVKALKQQHAEKKAVAAEIKAAERAAFEGRQVTWEQVRQEAGRSKVLSARRAR